MPMTVNGALGDKPFKPANHGFQGVLDKKSIPTFNLNSPSILELTTRLFCSRQALNSHVSSTRVALATCPRYQLSYIGRADSLFCLSCSLYPCSRQRSTIPARLGVVFSGGRDLPIRYLSIVAIIVLLTIRAPSLLHSLSRVLVTNRPRRPHLSLQAKDVPGVDILITACGEDHDLTMNVVRAACETDWAKDRLHVILLDDGRSEALQDSMQRLQRTYPWAHYTRRKKPEIPDYKTGNSESRSSLQRWSTGWPVPVRSRPGCGHDSTATLAASVNATSIGRPSVGYDVRSPGQLLSNTNACFVL